jgi:bleomycin hydrolase
LADELKNTLEYAKNTDLWEEKTVRSFFEVILDKHLGEPPQAFDFEGKRYDPQTFAREVLKVNPDDYVMFMSTLKIPFYTEGEFEVYDNWWRADDYHNVPLNEFYDGIKGALKKGYSVAIAVDVSEPGKDGPNDVMFIPPYDIPGQFIDQLAREYRITNESTTDDHAIHLVGYARRGDHDWFLAKDSGSSAAMGRFKGYFFVRDDYIRLKVLAFAVHKDAVSILLAKFQGKPKKAHP